MAEAPFEEMITINRLTWFVGNENHRRDVAKAVAVVLKTGKLKKGVRCDHCGKKALKIVPLGADLTRKDDKEVLILRAWLCMGCYNSVRLGNLSELKNWSYREIIL